MIKKIINRPNLKLCKIQFDIKYSSPWSNECVILTTPAAYTVVLADRLAILLFHRIAISIPNPDEKMRNVY